MFYKDEILARLAKGEDAQAIADDLANTLNDAIQEHLDTQAANEKKSVKADRVAFIMGDILDFMEDYYPELYDPELRDFDKNELLSFVEDAVEETKKVRSVLSEIDGALDELIKATKTPEEKKCKCKPKSSDPIADFLRDYVNN